MGGPLCLEWSFFCVRELEVPGLAGRRHMVGQLGLGLVGRIWQKN